MKISMKQQSENINVIDIKKTSVFFKFQLCKHSNSKFHWNVPLVTVYFLNDLFSYLSALL